MIHQTRINHQSSSYVCPVSTNFRQYRCRDAVWFLQIAKIGQKQTQLHWNVSSFCLWWNWIKVGITWKYMMFWSFMCWMALTLQLRLVFKIFPWRPRLAWKTWRRASGSILKNFMNWKINYISTKEKILHVMILHLERFIQTL